MIQKANEYGRVVVLLNNDDWLVRKKGKYFMDVEERKAILESMSLVANIFVIPGDKDSACDGIRECLKYYTEGYRPSDMKRRDYLFIFANGGDRINANTPEIETCTELGVCLLWGLGSKIQSSSDLTRRYAEE